MAITTMSMVLTVFVLNLHHVSDRPIPQWSKTVVMVYLARFMLMCGTHRTKRQESTSDECAIMLHPLNESTFHTPEDEKESDDLYYTLEELGGSPWVRRDSYKVRNGFKNGFTKEKTKYGLSNDRVEVMKNNIKDAVKVDHTKDWKSFSEIFDRLFFYLFLLAIMITTLVLFQPMTRSYVQQLKRGTL